MIYGQIVHRLKPVPPPPSPPSMRRPAPNGLGRIGGRVGWWWSVHSTHT